MTDRSVRFRMLTAATLCGAIFFDVGSNDASSQQSQDHDRVVNLSSVTPTVPQVPVKRIERNTCRSCVIELSPFASLSIPDSSGRLGAGDNWLTSDTQGRFFAYSADASGFGVFDPRGRLTARVDLYDGDQADSAGIYSILVGPGDSIFVYDGVRDQVTVFSSDLRFGRRFPLRLDDGKPRLFMGDLLLSVGGIRSPERVGYPLHLFNKVGDIVSSFGAQTSAFRPDVRELIEMREVTSAGPVSVWSGWWNQYRVERWNSSQRVVEIIERQVEWFEPWWRLPRDESAAPVPILVGLQQVGDTLLVLTRIADRDWRLAAESAGGLSRVEDRDRVFDTMVEAIDLRKEGVIATARLPWMLFGFAGPGLVYGEAQVADGQILIPVWKLNTLSQSTRGD